MINKCLLLVIVIVCSCNQKRIKENVILLKDTTKTESTKKNSISFDIIINKILNDSNNNVKILTIPTDEWSSFFYNSELDFSKYLGQLDIDFLKKEYRYQDAIIKDHYSFLFSEDQDVKTTIDSLSISNIFPLNEGLLAVISQAKIESDAFFGFAKIISTYNNNSKKIIDSKFINVMGSGNNNWSHNGGFYINKNLEIKSVIHNTEESIHDIIERKLKINSKGIINIKYLKQYDILGKKELHDYKNDYKEFEIDPISKEEKEVVFKELITKIPRLSLPYNSKEFYSYMEIESPEKDKASETILQHNKLKLYDETKYFFSKNPNDIAFKKEGKDYKEGHYFYPIGKFDITDEKVGVIYLYQSFCNYHPTVYIQLNTYDKKGNIIDEQILDRRFYSGAYRFLSSIQIQEDLKIDIKSHIQSYDRYHDGNQDLEQPELKETSFQITPKGLIK